MATVNLGSVVGPQGPPGQFLIVNVTVDDNDVETFIADKTRSEVITAMQTQPVFCNFYGDISLFVKEEGYPEIFANITNTAPATTPGNIMLSSYYFEYAEDGTFSGSKELGEVTGGE